jgi:Ca-activated chloride channel homolog
MTGLRLDELTDRNVTEPDADAGFGALTTERGNLPLRRLDVRATITGLAAGIELTQGFRNSYAVPLEATYVFPLPPRAALTRMTMTAGDRVIEGVLQERAQARQAYEQAIQAGQRAGIAEEERPDVFTLRVGNILPGEDVTVSLTLAAPLASVDGEAEFRFPLVVAPRYIPGALLPGPDVGAGTSPDTDQVPDASRITPPVLLPGFPNPVALSIEVRVDPAGLPLTGMASSLHAVSETGGVVRIQPGERVDRDFILRLSYGDDAGADSMVLVPDAAGAQEADGAESGEGTFRLTILPPRTAAPPRPRDVVLVLDRSGSMGGWKMVAARRAAARIVDTLTGADRFTVLTFDHEVLRPDGFPDALVPADDRNRFRAVEHLARTDARGGTELLDPLRRALSLLPAGETGAPGAEPGRDRVLVLVTDGQVGNEDQILRETGGGLAAVRVHTVGIDRAVNAGFLGRLAAAGGGRCELVESEDRLDAAMDAIHRRISAPLVRDLAMVTDSLQVVPGTPSPARVPHLFPGVPLVVTGRYRGAGAGGITVSGTAADGTGWQRTVRAVVSQDGAATAIWARAHLRDLEDGYAVTSAPPLEHDIVACSLRFGVLCRFTAYVAIDPRAATEGGQPHRVIQPVEQPSGWETFAGGGAYQPPGMPFAAMPAAGGFDAMLAAPMAAGVRPASASGRVMPAASRRARSAGRPEAASEPAGGSATGTDDLVRQQLADELDRLRHSASEPAGRRLELLDDLVSRLEALVVHLDSRADATADVLRTLLARLRDPAVPLDDRWADAEATLQSLAGAGPARREAFWKR